MAPILSFRGEFRFCSNFQTLKIPVIFENLEFFQTENAYVAGKTLDIELRKEIQNIAPGQAKSKGREIFEKNLFPNPAWNDEFKLKLMEDLVFQKFSKNEDLKEKLLATGDCEIIEGNTWHDNFFGSCTCGDCPPEKQRPKEEQNNLGKILMRVRAKLRQG
jgi:ribA/ribD-fused uncharacterized protein